MTTRGKRMHRIAAALTALLLMSPAAWAEDAPAPAYEFPAGFCYAHDYIEDVILDIRYAGARNYVGDPIDGY